MRRRLAAIVLLAIVLLAACHDGGNVPLASKSADPASVVRAFVAALSARNIDTAKRMMTPTEAERVARSPDSWFTNVKSIKNLSMEKSQPDRRSGHRQAVFVPVEFDLQQRQMTSMPNGRTVWGYVLVRDTDSDPWLIDDQGPV